MFVAFKHSRTFKRSARKSTRSAGAFSVKEKAWWRWRQSLWWSKGKKGKKKAWLELVARSPNLRRRCLGCGGAGGGGGGFGETLLGVGNDEEEAEEE
ncbi:hypothetical protein TIFTF001_051310 [Ficus carica]|uniref:Uncharacterized protein n=1 Tax=Ficus carica TaxID=3494 RepID=A0AA88CNK1_FICCA|nr:hypothetical protein TIFTF001_051310 [Ficus carica]